MADSVGYSIGGSSESSAELRAIDGRAFGEARNEYDLFDGIARSDREISDPVEIQSILRALGKPLQRFQKEMPEKQDLIDGVPESFVHGVLENPYIEDSMRKWKYMLPTVLDSNVYYDQLRQQPHGVYIVRTGGDEAFINFPAENGTQLSMSLDFGNMGPANNALGKVIKNSKQNIVDYFLQEVYEIALHTLSNGDATGFIKAVSELGEKLTGTNIKTRMTEPEFKEFLRKNNFDDVSYEEYLNACRESYNMAYQRQVGRDIMAMAKAVIQKKDPSNEHPSEEDVKTFLEEYFFDPATNSCGEILHYLKSEDSDFLLNENKEYVIERIEKLQKSDISAEEFIVSLIDFVYVQLRKKEQKNQEKVIPDEGITFPLQKELEIGDTQRNHFVPRDVHLLNVQAAVTNWVPQSYSEYHSANRFLEESIGRAKMNGTNLVWVVSPEKKHKDAVTKKIHKEVCHEQVGQKIIDYGIELKNIDAEITNEGSSPEIMVKRSEVLSLLNKIRYKNMNTDGDVKSEAFLKNVPLQNYQFELDTYQMVTINVENSGALNAVSHKLLDDIISVVKTYLMREVGVQKFEIARDGGGQLRYVGEVLSETDWGKIASTLSGISEYFIEEKIGEKKNDVMLDNITRKSNHIYKKTGTGHPEKPSNNPPGTFKCAVHKTVARCEDDGDRLTPNMHHTFYEIVSAA